MPRLQQLECSILLGRSDTALPEYRVKYHDGAVECRIAAPDLDINFVLRIQAHSYISPGLAVFVFIDGIYHANRNVSVSADGTVELRLRQKEEKLPNDSFIGREWTFAKLGRTAPSGSKRDKQFEDNVGKIEVVVLRCCYDNSAPAKADSVEAASVKSAKKSESVVSGGLFGGFGMGLFDGAYDIAQFDGPSEYNTGRRGDHTPLHGSWAGDSIHGVYRPQEGLYRGNRQPTGFNGRGDFGMPELYQAQYDEGRRQASLAKERKQRLQLDRVLDMDPELLDVLLNSRKVRNVITSDTSNSDSSDSPSSSNSSSDETAKPVKHKSRKKHKKKEKKHRKKKDKKRDHEGSKSSKASVAKPDGDEWGAAVPGSWKADSPKQEQVNADGEWAANNQQNDDTAQDNSKDQTWGDNAAPGWGDNQENDNKGADNDVWGADDNKSKSSERSLSHDGGSSNSSHSSPEFVRVKPYWSAWNKSAAARLVAGARQPAHAALRSPYQYPALAGPAVSSQSKVTTDRGVQAGKGASYEHQMNRPMYLDSVEAPYAVFTFKYSSRHKLEAILGRKIKKEMDAVVEEAERDRMLEMTKEQMIEELLKLRKQHDCADASASIDVASARSVSGQSTKSKKSSRSVKASSNAGWGQASTKSKASNKGFTSAPQDTGPVTKW